MNKPAVTSFFDEATNTVSYVVADPAGNACAVIDPVLEFDQASGRTATDSAQQIVDFIRDSNLEPVLVLETHVHADHLTAASFVAGEFGCPIAIGTGVTAVQSTFRDVFNAGDVAADGSQFDRLLADGERFEIGGLTGRVLHTPGHTPGCSTYVIGDAAFVGDTLFMPDYGTARCDFPDGDAGVLYDSIQKIFELPDDTRLFMCHDYKAPGRDHFAWETSVAEQRQNNVHIKAGVTRDEFIAFREARDAKLGMPRLIIPSVQVNIRAGELPPPEANGTSYLKVPLDTL